ncbi:MAG TPA: hypothetical protein VFY28_02320 [Candidatus Paceibacterota bacterium]|nr:hypothetical protein [Candidatus Paceibacterota bacterium]
MAARPVAPGRQGIYTTVDSDITYRVAIRQPGSLEPRAIADFCAENGVVRAIAPTFGFTRTVADPKQFEESRLPNGIPLLANPGLECDAVVLSEPGDALIGSFGGCAAIAAVHGDLMVAGHGGRDNLVHRDFVMNATEQDAGSIVDAMARRLGERTTRPTKTRGSCRAFYNLQRKDFRFDFDHPEQGAYNQQLYGLLRTRYYREREQMMMRADGGFLLDQGRLIGAQARRHFQTVSTCLYPLKNRAYAHTRHPDERMRRRRNLVAIVRVT